MFADPKLITYEVVYTNNKDTFEKKHFTGDQSNEAVTFSASMITKYNTDPEVVYAYVVLSRLPDTHSSVGRNMLSWTKPYKG